MFIGYCLPQKVESINIAKQGENYDASVEWAEDSFHENTQGRIMGSQVMHNSKDLASLAGELRKNKKELFIITITSFEEFVCWYLE